MTETVTLQLIQSLPTYGARAAAVFSHQGSNYLAIPQLAKDIVGAAASMNLGDSDIPLIVYKEDTHGRFEHFQDLPVSGGEDAEFFTINGRSFLATASLRSGKGPYNMDVESIIYEWVGDSFSEFQRIPTFAAKQWKYFTIDNRHFLALAQGAEIPDVAPKVPSESTIFEWSGSSFLPFQTITSRWGYNFHHFSLDGYEFLAYADHLEPSVLLKWNGEKFVHHQTLDGRHGRAFCFFRDKENFSYLAFSRISDNSLVYRWDGKFFLVHQTLEGQGGREFALVEKESHSYVIHVRFITGDRHDPNPALDSKIYRIEKEGLRLCSNFPTLGGTDVGIFSKGGDTLVVVAESLNKNIQFRTDTHIYRFVEEPAVEIPPTRPPFQSPEFLELFTSYTASQTSIGSQLTATVARATSSNPLLVATSFDMLLFPGHGQDPSYINFRLSSRGFKELAAISHLGPALASLIKIKDANAVQDLWRKHANDLLAKTEAAQKVNSTALWRDQIKVEAYQGREAAIASMVDYACSLTVRLLKHVLENPSQFTADFLRRNYLEATETDVGATVPFNAIMIATFFLVGLDTSYRMRKWFEKYQIQWRNAMVLVVGRQGRETSGVTVSTNSVAQIVLQSSNMELPLGRLYIAPHGVVPDMQSSTGAKSLKHHETYFRSLWNALHGMGQLGETMFSGYPAYKAEQNSRPVIDISTAVVSELPKITSPDDWFAMNTRMRVVLEDARQLLSGCVTDYAAEQLRLVWPHVSKVIVPGLDDVDYSSTMKHYAPLRQSTTVPPVCLSPARASPPTAVQTCKVRGAVLAYRETGPADGEAMIWIHGLPLDNRSWAGQYERFSQDNHNIWVDLRGYGSSSKLPDYMTDVTQLYCDDLLALMSHLSIQKAIIVGFASAGHIALRFAAQNPQNLKGLVLLNASPRFLRNNTDFTFGFTEEQIKETFVSVAESEGIEALVDRVLDPATVFQDLSIDDAAHVGSWMREMAYTAGLNTLLGFFKHMVFDDDRHLVPSIKTPTLLLSSSLGKEVPSQTALYLRQHLQHSKLVEIADADHFFHITRPAIVNDLIAGFLASLRKDNS